MGCIITIPTNMKKLGYTKLRCKAQNLLEALAQITEVGLRIDVATQRKSVSAMMLTKPHSEASWRPANATASVKVESAKLVSDEDAAARTSLEASLITAPNPQIPEDDPH